MNTPVRYRLNPVVLVVYLAVRLLPGFFTLASMLSIIMTNTVLSFLSFSALA